MLIIFTHSLEVEKFTMMYSKKNNDWEFAQIPCPFLFFFSPVFPKLGIFPAR